MSGANSIWDLDTPVLLVDRKRLDENIRAMQRSADSAGVRLRPHIKTHKSKQIAELQLRAGAAGITCAKLSEAEVMREICNDIFIAYPIVGEQKLERLSALNRSIRTCVSVESLEAARQMNVYFQQAGDTQKVRVKIDTGLKRTGIEVSDLADFLASLSLLTCLEITGLFTHEGMAAKCGSRESVEESAAGVSRQMKQAHDIYREVIGRNPEISVGCSATAPIVQKDDGFTEMRPGTYVFTDRSLVETGMYRYEQCALSVLTRIVAIKSDGRVIIDGGSKTFGLDRTPQGEFGLVVDHPDLRIERFSEEHGVLITESPGNYKVGGLLQIIPAHVCPVVNLHEELFLYEDEEVVEVVSIDARGCVT